MNIKCQTLTLWLAVERASLAFEVQSMRQQSGNDKVNWPKIPKQRSKQAMPPAVVPEVKYNRRELGEGDGAPLSLIKTCE